MSRSYSTVDLQINQQTGKLKTFNCTMLTSMLITGNFERVFVCPPTSRSNFQHFRRIVTADGTFLTRRFNLTLLLAVGIDADGRNVILAWAVVESENRDSWEYFLRLLRRCIPEIISERCVFISDGDKGLVEADVCFGRIVFGLTVVSILNAILKTRMAPKMAQWRFSGELLELDCL